MFSQPDIVISPTAMRVMRYGEQFLIQCLAQGAQALKQGPKSTNTTAWKTKKESLMPKGRHKRRSRNKPI